MFPYIRTWQYLCADSTLRMKQKFDVIFLDEAWDFLETLDEKTKDKIIYVIDKSKYAADPELFKKLDNDIWEFRIKYNKLNYRMLAFWDKTDNTETLVVATHGFAKKTSKIPKSEIDKAVMIMKLYFKQK